MVHVDGVSWHMLMVYSGTYHSNIWRYPALLICNLTFSQLTDSLELYLEFGGGQQRLLPSGRGDMDVQFEVVTVPGVTQTVQP